MSGAAKYTELKNERVGVVGTGATVVQIARWAKEVVFLQRTVANVYPRHKESCSCRE